MHVAIVLQQEKNLQVLLTILIVVAQKRTFEVFLIQFRKILRYIVLLTYLFQLETTLP